MQEDSMLIEFMNYLWQELFTHQRKAEVIYQSRDDPSVLYMNIIERVRCILFLTVGLEAPTAW